MKTRFVGGCPNCGNHELDAGTLREGAYTGRKVAECTRCGLISIVYFEDEEMLSVDAEREIIASLGGRFMGVDAAFTPTGVVS
jgi:hypothetical protein